jgi:aspartokinase-like uncharacterized kinase
VTRACLAVIKVGGSLLDWPELPIRLGAFVASQFPTTGVERPILIAGGGPAADVIRALDRVHQLGDKSAHELAIRAMDLSAHLLAALMPSACVIDSLESAEQLLASGRVPVLAPFGTMRAIEQCEPETLPASWDVTSDSIAACIAVHINASRLIILKSTSIDSDATRHEAARAGLVDPFFPIAAQALHRVEYLNLRDSLTQLELLRSTRS